MKAIAFTEHGGLNVLQSRELPTPEPGPGEVLVKVEACGLNHLDLWTRQGLGIPIPMPHILGCEPVGTIAALGPGVETPHVGDFVVCSPGVSCGNCAACLSGNDSLCNDYQVTGFQRQGGYAEYCVHPAKDVIVVSRELSATDWAAVPLVFLTAWHMLITRAALQPGESVLVHGAGSGIGSAAIQIAKLMGCEVIVTAGSEAKIARGLELGADAGINYQTTPAFHRDVKTLTHGRGVDVVFEHIGPATWTESLASLTPGGRVVFCGATTGPTVTLDLRFIFVRQYSILGSYMGAKHELLRVLRLVEERQLKPVIDTIFPLADAKLAQQKMINRDFFGKLVLAV